jgi:hypothetical protein
MHVTFTRRPGRRYRIDVVRPLDPAAAMHVAPGFDEFLPHDLARFIVEREFGLKLGIFGQLAAGGDAGTFWCAPADRTARLAQRAHRLRVAGRGDLSRSEQLTAACLAAWEINSGRRTASDPWPVRALHDCAIAAPERIAVLARVFDEISLSWQALSPDESLRLEWPAELTLRNCGRLRSA